MVSFQDGDTSDGHNIQPLVVIVLSVVSLEDEDTSDGKQYLISSHYNYFGVFF